MKLYHRIIIALLDVTRPLLGGMGMVCIYEISCLDYAKEKLQNDAWYKSIPCIIARVLSCNPITALLRKKNYL